MSAVECEVCELVREPGLAQSVDVRIAAEVLGMTAPALTARALTHPTVVPASAADIGGDLLVTIQAKRGLPVAVSAVVTSAAIAFQLGVRMAHRSRHDQLLDAGRTHRRTDRQGEYHEKQRRRADPWRAHVAEGQ